MQPGCLARRRPRNYCDAAGARATLMRDATRPRARRASRGRRWARDACQAECALRAGATQPHLGGAPYSQGRLLRESLLRRRLGAGGCQAQALALRFCRLQALLERGQPCRQRLQVLVRKGGWGLTGFDEASRFQKLRMTGTKGVETFTTGFLFLKMFNNACGVVCVSDLKIKTFFLLLFLVLCVWER